MAVARVEAGRVLRHPAFLAGAAATLRCCCEHASRGCRGMRGNYLAQFACALLWIGTLAAAALVAGRQRLLAEPDAAGRAPALACRWRRANPHCWDQSMMLVTTADGWYGTVRSLRWSPVLTARERP
jgi:hypothetical protein